MKRILYFCFVFMLIAKVQAQNITILPSGITPAVTNNYPRISYDAILSLPSPIEGALTYDTTFKCLRIYTEGKWLCSYETPLNYSPNIIEAATAGGSGNDSGTSIAIDAVGNIYVTGTYTGTANFELTNKTSLGSDDIFVSKYNQNGILQWVQSAGGADKDSVYSIAVDVTGNVYITGYYKGIATFDATTVTSLGDTDIFVAKYNTNGVFQWVQSAGGTGCDVGSGMVIDGTNNIYIVGSYAGNAAFGAIIKTAAGLSDIFLAKYDVNGIPQWVESAGGTNDDFGQAIALDGSGKIHITGHFKGSANFGAINKIADATYFDVFVARFDPVGSAWTDAQSAGGTNHEYSQSIAVDASGNVYVVGNFKGTFLFGSGSKTSAGGGFDMFTIKFNSSGTPQWINTLGGTGFESGRGVIVDNKGNVLVVGFYSWTGTSFGIEKSSLGLDDAYIINYASNSDFIGIKVIGWTGNDMAKSIAADGKGNIYVTGHFSNSIAFDKKIKTSQGGTDMFVIRLDK